MTDFHSMFDHSKSLPTCSTHHELILQAIIAIAKAAHFNEDVCLGVHFV